MITFADGTHKNENNYDIQNGITCMVVAKLKIPEVVRSLPFVRVCNKSHTYMRLVVLTASLTD